MIQITNAWPGHCRHLVHATPRSRRQWGDFMIDHGSPEFREGVERRADDSAGPLREPDTERGIALNIEYAARQRVDGQMRGETSDAGAVRWHLSAEMGVVQILVAGRARAREFERLRAELVADPSFRPGLTAFADLRGAEPSEMEDLIAGALGFLARASELAFERVAFVAPDGSAATVAERFAHLAHSSSTAFRVFRDPLSALRWCDSKTPPVDDVRQRPALEHDGTGEHPSIAAAVACIGRVAEANSLDALSDEALTELYECVRSLTIALRDAGSSRNAIQATLDRILAESSPQRPVHSAVRAAVLEWVEEAFGEDDTASR